MKVPIDWIWQLDKLANENKRQISSRLEEFFLSLDELVDGQLDCPSHDKLLQFQLTILLRTFGFHHGKIQDFETTGRWNVRKCPPGTIERRTTGKSSDQKVTSRSAVYSWMIFSLSEWKRNIVSLLVMCMSRSIICTIDLFEDSWQECMDLREVKVGFSRWWSMKPDIYL